jgi:hypothetical protein
MDTQLNHSPYRQRRTCPRLRLLPRHILTRRRISSILKHRPRISLLSPTRSPPARLLIPGSPGTTMDRLRT